MTNSKRVRRIDLVDAEAHNEVCLVSIDDDGTLWLNHLEIELWNKDGGDQRGSIVFNGEIRLPLTKFEW